MIERRPFHELPSEDLGWLKARRHFSSAAKDDPSRSGWGCMRVWNDEEIAPNAGFALQVHEPRLAYLVPSTGTVDVNGVRIHARDGAAIKDVDMVTITAIEDADVLMVDVL